MSRLVPRPSDVRGLATSPAFTDRLLGRIHGHLGFTQDEGYPVLDLLTSARIDPDLLEQAVVVYVTPRESIAARVYSARSADGACRLFLYEWKVFVNTDPHTPQVPPGVHIWLGASWRQIPAYTVH